MKAYIYVYYLILFFFYFSIKIFFFRNLNASQWQIITFKLNFDHSYFLPS